jgi:hypothetical protein
MNCLLLLSCLSFALPITQAQLLSQNLQLSAAALRQGNDAQLQLSTSVANESYAVGGGALRLELDLTYSNTGNVPVLVDRQSSLVYRIQVSRTLKKALEKKYEYDARVSYSSVRSMREAGMRTNRPERDAFVLLKPGESHSVRQEIILHLYDGAKATRDRLHPGDHYLQLKVATWYYFSDPEVYQEKWKNEGYVWARNITSKPLPLRIRKVF